MTDVVVTADTNTTPLAPHFQFSIKKQSPPQSIFGTATTSLINQS
jgi:hypothetical protein